MYRILKNFSYLSLIQIVSVLTPFVTYPYIIRCFGPEKYGHFIIAFNLFFYIQIITNYGFELSATKKISIKRDDIDEVNFIFSVVTSIKIFILLCTFFTLLVLPSDESKYLYILIFLYYASESLLPTWYFQGVERMVVMSLSVALSRFSFIALVFGLINESSNPIELAYIYLISSLFSFLVCYLYIFKSEKIKFKKITKDEIIFELKDGFPVFFSRLTAAFNMKIGGVFLGIAVGPSMASYYDLAQKIVDILRVPLNMLNQAIYPRVSKTKEIKLVKISIIISLVYSLFIMAVFYFFSEDFLTYFAGDRMNYANEPLKILMLSVPISAISWFIGNTYLLVRGENFHFLVSVLLGSLLILFLMIFLYWNNAVSLIAISIISVLSAFITLIYRMVVYYGIQKRS